MRTVNARCGNPTYVPLTPCRPKRQPIWQNCSLVRLWHSNVTPLIAKCARFDVEERAHFEDSTERVDETFLGTVKTPANVRWHWKVASVSLPSYLVLRGGVDGAVHLRKQSIHIPVRIAYRATQEHDCKRDAALRWEV